MTWIAFSSSRRSFSTSSLSMTTYLIFRVFVAGDDFVAWHFAMDGARLLVLDAAIACGVQLVEADFGAAAGGGRIRLDGDRDETDAEKAFPQRTSGHDDPF